MLYQDVCVLFGFIVFTLIIYLAVKIDEEINRLIIDLSVMTQKKTEKGSITRIRSEDEYEYKFRSRTKNKDDCLICDIYKRMEEKITKIKEKRQLERRKFLEEETYEEKTKRQELKKSEKKLDGIKIELIYDETILFKLLKEKSDYIINLLEKTHRNKENIKKLRRGMISYAEMVTNEYFQFFYSDLNADWQDADYRFSIMEAIKNKASYIKVLFENMCDEKP